MFDCQGVLAGIAPKLDVTAAKTYDGSSSRSAVTDRRVGSDAHSLRATLSLATGREDAHRLDRRRRHDRLDRGEAAAGRARRARHAEHAVPRRRGASRW